MKDLKYGILIRFPHIKVNAKNVNDQTVLNIANQNGHFGIVDLIVSVLMNENEWIRNL